MVFIGKRIALITGSTRGVGLSISKKLLELGNKVIITGKNKDLLMKTKEKLCENYEENNIYTQVCNLRYSEEIDILYNDCINNFGNIDILINNAGTLNIKNIKDISNKEFNILNNINYHAPFLLTQKVLPSMIENKYGRIIFHSPPLNYYNNYYKMTPYLISKYQMSYLSLFLSNQFKNQNITFNTVWPKKALATDAVMSRQIGDEKDWRKPEIIADTIAFMLEENQKFTGNEIIDEFYLKTKNINDFKKYRTVSEIEPMEMEELFKQYL